MTSIHITVGSADDLDHFHEWVKEHDTAGWPLPKQAKPGDTVLFLIPAYIGDIVAEGTVDSEPIPSVHWKPKYEAAIRDIRFRANPLPIDLLRQRMPDWKYLSYARSYTTVPAEFVEPLRDLLRLQRPYDLEAGVLPEEVGLSGFFSEGAVRVVQVNAYERSPEARRRCIAHYGAKCAVCGFDFGKTYGPVADGFIHVHHLVPLSDMGEEYEVNPIEDLRPVCPNCHAIIHRGLPNPYTIEQVKAFLQQSCKAADPRGGGRSSSIPTADA